MTRALLLAVCLLVGSLQAQGLFGDPPELGQMPSRFIRFEALSLGVQGAAATERRVDHFVWLAGGSRLADATLLWHRLRVGIAALDAWGPGYGQGTALVPVHIGFTILSRPRRLWRVYSMAQDAYVEATGSLWRRPLAYEPSVRVAMGCAWDFFGVGLRLEAGWGAYGDNTIQRNESVVYAGLQVRLLTFGIGF